MDIFDQFGIKEVADCTLYSIHKKKDGSGDIYFVPALFLDTLKVSSIGKTSQNVWANGGVGNDKFICWDYGKDITITLQDALFSPASFNLCWGGVLNSNWDNDGINLNTGEINGNEIVVQRFSKMSKYSYPFDNIEKNTVGHLLPCSERDIKDNPFGLVNKSSIVDGIKIEGFGFIKCQNYKWRMEIDSKSKSIWVIPNKFYDVYGRPYKIIKRINFDYPWIDNNYGTRVIYKINRETPIEGGNYNTIENADYLEVRIDNNGNYTAWLGDAQSLDRARDFVPNPKSFIKNDKVELCQFKGIDMWRKFDGINEMIYFLITKYNKNIIYIDAADVPDIINKDVTSNMKLWSYINPKTMKPFNDDYWFNAGETFLLKSFTLVPIKEQLKAKRIQVKSDQFPGMYMIVGETYIRREDTKQDQRMQFRIPLCKIKTDNTINLQSDGDPTVFDMTAEVAVPRNKIMMELTTYETAPRLELNEYGELVLKDGAEDIIGVRGD